MLELEHTLIQRKVDGVFNEAEHHAIAAKLKDMSDEWDRIEQETGKRPQEAFDFTFGLIMGKELIYFVLPKDEVTLRQKIEVARWQ